MKFNYILYIMIFISCNKEKTTRIPYIEVEIPDNLKGVWKSENLDGSTEFFRLEKNNIKNGELINIEADGKINIRNFTFYIERNQMRWNEVSYKAMNYLIRNDSLILETSYKTYKYYSKSTHETFDNIIKPTKIKETIGLPKSITLSKYSIVVKNNYLYYVAENKYLYKFDLINKIFTDSFLLNDKNVNLSIKNNSLFYCFSNGSFLWKVNNDFNNATIANNDVIEEECNNLSYEPKNQNFYFISDQKVIITLENGDYQVFASHPRGFGDIFYYKNDEFLKLDYTNEGIAYLQKINIQNPIKYSEAYMIKSHQQVKHISSIDGEIWLSILNSLTNNYELVNIEL